MATVINQWVQAVRQSSVFNPNTQVEPTVVLWTDKERQWQPVLNKLREVLPELL